MDVNGVMPLDVAHQIQVPLERDIGVVTTLQQNLDSPYGLAFVDLGADLLEAQDVSLMVLGTSVKRVELAIGNTDIGVVDVSIDDVGNHVLRMMAPTRRVREP